MAQTISPSAKAAFRAMAASVDTPTAGLSAAKGQPLGGGHADADAGKGAGADSHGNGVHVGQLQVRIFQDVLHNGHQGAAVGQPGVLIA